jgi:putative endonuclease
MWYDEYRNPKEAKAVEYKMKRWKRAWKEEVIFAENPEMDDLAEDWDFTLYLE